MALTIVTKAGKTYEYHVPFNNKENLFLTAPYVDYIIADGDELDYIKQEFSLNGWGKPEGSTVPFVKSFRKIMRWYGADAQFIVGNLV